CHAPSTNDTRATHAQLLWNVTGTGAAACGTCHGLPPSSHADNRCSVCHQAAFDNGHLNPQRHVNGVVDLGNRGSGCSGCHGDSTSSAPPNDVLGRTDETLQTVGAHRAHLEARHLLRGPIECTECHSVPSELHSPGHIDHLPPAVVF